jgi:hypothetical protein
MNDNDEIKSVGEPNLENTSPIVEETTLSSCTWDGEEFPEWYKVCRNGRVYQCLDRRLRNTGNSC